jgi:8-amino-7-oxononanoate synthase
LELEQELADWLGAEVSLGTTSAFAANVGLIPALTDRDTLVISDALNHASIVDGCRLSRARIVVTPHLDLEAIETALRARLSTETTAWVVMEALFSMDGESPDLPRLSGLCAEYRAGLILDEAHSLGVLGPSGAGLAREVCVAPDVVVAGLGKAVGSQGGVVATSRELREVLWNRARPFVFSTAISPALARLAVAQVRLARAADSARQRLLANSKALRAALRERGLPVSESAVGPIVPVVLGSNASAFRAMEVLRARGILVQAIRPPTVPEGAARLRITVHADWPDDAVPRLVEALEVACA